jgi:hypothetical protein
MSLRGLTLAGCGPLRLEDSDTVTRRNLQASFVYHKRRTASDVQTSLLALSEDLNSGLIPDDLA